MLRRRRTLKSGHVREAYYYDGRDDEGRRVEIARGPDLKEARRKPAGLEMSDALANTKPMRILFERYEREILPTKAPATQQDSRNNLAWRRRVSDAVEMDAVTPQHIAKYRDRRGAKAPVRANRETALLSHVFDLARE